MYYYTTVSSTKFFICHFPSLSIFKDKHSFFIDPLRVHQKTFVFITLQTLHYNNVPFFRRTHVLVKSLQDHLIMVVRDLEDLETYQDNKDTQLYKNSFTAEDFGYAVVLTTFILIVLLVCVVGLTITSPCCCRGNRVNLVSISYQKASSYVIEMPKEHQRSKRPLNPETSTSLLI